MCLKTSRLLGLGRSHVYDMAPPGTYAYFVRVATQKLRSATFGYWRGTKEEPSPIAGFPPEIIDYPPDDEFDTEYWKPIKDDTYVRVLQLVAGKQPSDAVDAILDRTGKWKIDCDHTVQVANLYAIRQVLGAANFNIRATQNMQLRPRDSTGLTTVLHFGCDLPTDQWRPVVGFDPTKAEALDVNHPTIQSGTPFQYGPGYFYAPGLNAGSPPEDTTTYLVRAATSGSRVRWTNQEVVLSNAFRHENCVKLEYDLFAAGGLGNVLTGNEFNRSQLEKN